MTPTKVLIGQMLVVFGIALAGTWAATQWVAFELGYQQRLGEPWFLIDRLPVYYPWRLFEWWYVYDAYAPDIFRTGGTIAGGSGVIAALSAIVGSVWRARQAKHVTTYGSARWADEKDIAEAKLTTLSGVFLGLMAKT